jgi:hypothetical protein
MKSFFVRGRIALAMGTVTVVVLALSGASAQAFFSYASSVPTTIGTPCLSEPEEPCPAGQLRNPTGVAKDTSTSLSDASAGDVYVADSGNNRIEKFSATGVYLSELSGTPTGPGGESVPFTGVSQIAVDNSENPLDPSAGDLYVVSGEGVIDKFSAAGQYVGQITGTPEGGFVGVFSLAVDAEGEVWVYSRNGNGNGEIDHFSDAVSNAYQSQFPTGGFVFSSSFVIAADGENVYANVEGELLEFTSAGLLAKHIAITAGVTGLTAGPVAGDILATEGTSVVEYDAAGNLLQQFGSFASANGVAVDPTNGSAYVADSGANVVDTFIPSISPSVVTEEASDFRPSSTTVHGSVDPDGTEVTSCVFEYGSEAGVYGQSSPCEAPYSGVPPYSGAPVHVGATLTGIETGKTYHYRLAASNTQGTGYGLDRTFVDAAVVSIANESVIDVAPESATLEAQINPGGVAATYRFEYGTSESYSTRIPVPDGAIEAATSDTNVGQHLQGLLPATVYHYRVVSGNASGSIVGPDQIFTTPAAGLAAATLPDGRQYEMVSPPQKDGSNVLGSTGANGVGASGEGGVGTFGGVAQASSDGTKVTYLASLPFAEPQGNAIGSQIVSTRGPQGWSSDDISTPHNTSTAVSIGHGIEYRAFSLDLSLGLVDPSLSREGPGDTPLSPLAPVGYRQLYLRDIAGDSYEPLLTGLPKENPKAFLMEFDGASANLRHVVVSMEGNLYEWGEGQLRIVNVRPEGGFAPNAVLGNDNTGQAGPASNTLDAISEDGSSVIWSELEGGTFVRNMTTGTTVPLKGGWFQAASRDHTRVFASSDPGGDLYLDDLADGTSRDLTGAPVEGVVGASEDASYVYFVSKEALEDSEGHVLSNTWGSQPSLGANNLYVLHEAEGTWTTTFVASLSGDDESDWIEGRKSRASEVAPNGRYVAFISDERLTGYDNRDANNGQPDDEVFVYSVESQRLTCASCNPTGARPIAGSGVSRPTEYQLDYSAYQPRYLSDEGRLFFESGDSLVTRDTNGTQDVYEWEPEGLGPENARCAPAAGSGNEVFRPAHAFEVGVQKGEEEAGCLGLISAGTGAGPSTFIDASASGDDAFFITLDRLVPQDFDNSFDMYDAHVCNTSVACSTLAAAQPPPCTSSDGCRSAPLPQPGVFGAPPSATFSGAGNLLSPSKPAKAMPRPAKCKKGFGKKHGKCVKIKVKERVKGPKVKKSSHRREGK